VKSSFYAFGVLLAMLALAIIAVGSSSRTTTVQAQPDDEGSLPTPTPHGTIYVVVLPAGDEPAPAVNKASVTEVATEVVRPPMLPVVVVAADCDAATKLQPENDCLSHYDRFYDELVYGRSAADVHQEEAATTPTSTDELISLFHSLSPSKSSPAASRSSFRRNVRGWQTTLRGAGKWLANRANDWTAARSGGGEPAVIWSEYSILMDRVAAEQNVAGPNLSAAAADAVRSGGWLLHFAVSSLSRMGLTLERAAADLQRYERALSDGE
jgi:hypothetical protein